MTCLEAASLTDWLWLCGCSACYPQDDLQGEEEMAQKRAALLEKRERREREMQQKRQELEAELEQKKEAAR